MKRVDRVTALVLLVLGLVAIFESLRLGLTNQGLPGGGLFPMLASAGIVLLAAIQYAQSRKGQGDAVPWPDAEGVRKTLIFSAALILYTLLTVPLGFFLSTMFFLLALLRYPGNYGWRANVVISVPLAFVLYFGLGRGLGVELPHGILDLVGL